MKVWTVVAAASALGLVGGSVPWTAEASRAPVYCEQDKCLQLVHCQDATGQQTGCDRIDSTYCKTYDCGSS